MRAVSVHMAIVSLAVRPAKPAPMIIIDLCSIFTIRYSKLVHILPKSSANARQLAGGLNRFGGVTLGTPDALQLAAG